MLKRTYSALPRYVKHILNHCLGSLKVSLRHKKANKRRLCLDFMPLLMLKIEVNSSYLEILNLVDNLKSIGQEGLYQKPVLRFSIFGVLYFDYVPFDPQKEIIYVDNY